MYIQILLVILLYNVMFGVVEAISIEGPPLTTYSPCGTRLLYFTKQTSTQWNATLDIKYQRTEAVITIHFVDDVTVSLIQTCGNKISLLETTNRTISIRLVPEPLQEIFSINMDTDKVPTVSGLIVNGAVICDDKLRSNETEDVISTYPYDTCSDRCGTRLKATEELYSVRTDAKHGDWPWHVGVYNDNEISCGGTIISATTVITTAYNFYNTPVSSVKVVAGITVFSGDEHDTCRQERQAIKLIFNPVYVYEEYETGDIALIKVNKFSFTTCVRPVCLWGPQYDRKSIVGKIGVIAGVGNGLHNAENSNKQLRSTDTMIQSEDECEKVAHEADKLIFCAGYGSKFNLSPTNDDTGGGLVIPIVVNGHVTWHLRGVFNACIMKNDTCDTTKYVTYTDVAAYYEWIQWHVIYS